MDAGWVSRRHQSIELAALGAALLVGGAKLSDMHAQMSRWTDVAGCAGAGAGAGAGAARVIYLVSGAGRAMRGRRAQQ
jgi:hypothetical protein